MHARAEGISGAEPVSAARPATACIFAEQGDPDPGPGTPRNLPELLLKGSVSLRSLRVRARDEESP